MFIDHDATRVRPPTGGPCPYESVSLKIDMALLTEGRVGVASHSINISLLTEGGRALHRGL